MALSAARNEAAMLELRALSISEIAIKSDKGKLNVRRDSQACPTYGCRCFHGTPGALYGSSICLANALFRSTGKFW